MTLTAALIGVALASFVTLLDVQDGAVLSVGAFAKRLAGAAVAGAVVFHVSILLALG